MEVRDHPLDSDLSRRIVPPFCFALELRFAGGHPVGAGSTIAAALATGYDSIATRATPRFSKSPNAPFPGSPHWERHGDVVYLSEARTAVPLNVHSTLHA